MIAFSTPPAKLHELRDLFVKIDVDDSGTISLEEFRKAMSLHQEVPQDRVEQMFRCRPCPGHALAHARAHSHALAAQPRRVHAVHT